MLKFRWGIVSSIVKSALVWHVHFGWDEVGFCFTPRAIWLTVVCLCRFILGTIKEMWIDWRWYKYEWYIPDYEEERDKAFRESDKRMDKLDHYLKTT